MMEDSHGDATRCLKIVQNAKIRPIAAFAQDTEVRATVGCLAALCVFGELDTHMDEGSGTWNKWNDGQSFKEFTMVQIVMPPSQYLAEVIVCRKSLLNGEGSMFSTITMANAEGATEENRITPALVHTTIGEQYNLQKELFATKVVKIGVPYAR